MKITIDPAKIRKTSLKANAMRFTLGGLVTVGAGLIGMAYGPAVGGLFLAFPSISTASLSLIQQDDGKNAAGVDALGAALGSLGLLGFGAVVWALAPRAAAWVVLLAANGAWLVLAIGLWLGFQWRRRRRKSDDRR